MVKPFSRIMKKYLFLFWTFTYCLFSLSAQNLKPGFDKEEYIELLKITAQTNQSKNLSPSFYPEKFVLEYASEEMGFDNCWTLWTYKNEVAVIAIRGTIETSVSWVANMYAAMVPAKGEIELDSNYTFKYELAENPKAAVHVGWLVATGFLSRDILSKIDSCYKSGIKDFYITGHSQGGAISFLMTSHLRNLQNKGELPADIMFKTYCSAGPKPGNTFYAYEYGAQTQDGWAYNVVNENDCVPMLPFSIQTFNDLIQDSPYGSLSDFVKNQDLPHKAIFLFIAKQLEDPSYKAIDAYRKFLGVKMEELVKRQFADYKAIEYSESFNYVRAGNQYVLKGTELYYEHFALTAENIALHHSPTAYYFLLKN